MTDNLTPASPLQRIESALAWLGELRAGATPGPWTHEGYEGVYNSKRRLYFQEPGRIARSAMGDYLLRPDAALIVALTHPAVLDAVEAVLRDGAQMYRETGGPGYADPTEQFVVAQALALADALLATKPEGGK